MAAYILVLSNPYFALTDELGQYVIDDVPKGEYQLRAWQRFGPSVSQPIRLTGSGKTPVDLELKEEKILLEHQNKWGRQYQGDY